MIPYVVDVSMAVKWFLTEVHADIARRLLDARYVRIVPDQFFVEFANVLWKRVRFGGMTEVEAIEVLRGLDAIVLEVHPSGPLALPALEIACGTHRTVYDSLYLALAIREQAPLVTADLRFYNAISSGPLAAHVCWIEDLR